MKIEEIRKSSPWRVNEGGNQEKLSGCQASEYLFQRNPKSMSACRHIDLNNLVTSSKKITANPHH